jgi:hypothetical protein
LREGRWLSPRGVFRSIHIYYQLPIFWNNDLSLIRIQASKIPHCRAFTGNCAHPQSGAIRGSTRSLTREVRLGHLERIGRGMYCLPVRRVSVHAALEALREAWSAKRMTADEISGVAPR